MSKVKIYAVGNKEQMTEFVMGISADRDSMFQVTFDKIIPTPRNDRGELCEDWYDWRISYWGGCKEEPTVMVNELFTGFDIGDLSKVITYKDFHHKSALEISNAIDNLGEHGLIAWEYVGELAWGIPDAVLLKLINDWNGKLTSLSVAYWDDDEYYFGCHKSFEGHMTSEEACVEAPELEQKVKYIKGLLEHEFLSINDLLWDIVRDLDMKLSIKKTSMKEDEVAKELEFNKRLYEKLKDIFKEYAESENWNEISKLFIDAIFGRDIKKEEC